MDEHVKQVLLFAVGLLLTIGVITLYLKVYREMDASVTVIRERENEKQNNIASYSLTRYDQCIIYGSQVINYLKENYLNFEEVLLDSGTGAVLVTDTAHFRSAGHEFYIYGNGIYLVELEYNENHVPTKVTVIKQ